MMNRFEPEGTEKPGPMGPPAGLARFGSAPGSLLTGIADSVIGGAGEISAVGSEGGGAATASRFFFSGAESPSRLSSAESSCAARAGFEPGPGPGRAGEGGSYGSAGVHVAGGDRAALVRHSSSPAGLLAHLAVDRGPRGIGSYSQTGTEFVHATTASQKLRPQWSFSRQDSLSQIAEMSIPDIGESSNDFSITSWGDTNSIMFSAPSSKRAKDDNGDIITSLSNLDSQIGLQGTSLEISGMENYLQIQEDSVACKLRAKRGCATHPRSIAERERRIRISKRLRKLQDLVPNMDKQTSTSDMLDLAVEYIKDLQSQVQKLNEEQANCTCSSKV